MTNTDTPESNRTFYPTSADSLHYHGFFEHERFSPLIINVLVLIFILATYSIIGSLFTILASERTFESFVENAENLQLIINDENLSAIRWVQFLAQVIIIAGPILILVPLHTGEWNPFSKLNRSFLGINAKPSFNELFFASLSIILLHPLLSLIGELQLTIVDILFGTGEELKANQKAFETIIKQLTQVRSPLEFFAIVGLIAATPAICEELLFRGYIQKNFSRVLKPFATIIITGTIFGAFHLNLFEFMPLVALGVFISYLRYQSDSIAVSMTAHFANNFFSLVVMLFTLDQNIDVLDSFQNTVFTFESMLFITVSTFLCLLSFRYYLQAVRTRMNSV